MPSSFNAAQREPGVASLPPAADAAGRTGVYTTLKNAHKATLKFLINQGNAATVTLTVNQAKDVAGTGAKALAVVRWWATVDDTAAAGDVLVRQADGASFITDAGLKPKRVYAEIDASDLDQANGFVTIAPVTGASNAANITACLTETSPARFASDQPPSLIAN